MQRHGGSLEVAGKATFEDAADSRGVLLVIMKEALASGVAQHPGAASEFLDFPGQRMCLLVVDHLQLVLDVAQEHVSAGERFGIIGLYQREGAQRFKGFQRAALADLDKIAAVFHLKSLGDEFDFTNS